MPKQSIKVEVNNFVQGLVTEASPLNFPPNATTDETNFVLHRDGTRSRRLGMDFEAGYGLSLMGTTAGEIAANPTLPYKWTNVSGVADVNFLVVQVRAKLYIYNLGYLSLSGNPIVGTIDLSSIGFSADVTYSFTAVDGRLVVAAGASLIAIINYVGGIFTLDTRSLLVRDVWGLEVTADPQYETNPLYRGTESIPAHNYNLYNQSWGIPRNDGSVFRDPVSIYAETLKYPSNSETVWAGLQFQPIAAGSTPSEKIYVSLYEQVFGASVKAAKGYFIIDVLRRGVSRAQNIVDNFTQHPEMAMETLTTRADYTPGGATTVCEFAGRVFYAGFKGAVVDGDKRSPSLPNYILFSQLVRSTDDIHKCYQSGDPTSRDSNDLLDTDGGFIRLSGAESILGMINLGSVLAVFARNGVWVISGGGDDGFKATNYKSDRISSFGSLSVSSIVEDGARALYWSENGIYAVVRGQFGEYTSTNITEKIIQRLYDEIPVLSKVGAIGVFDSIGKKLRWLYHTGALFTSTSVTKELILDLTTGAFSTSSIENLASNSTHVIAPFTALPFSVITAEVDVLADIDPVMVLTQSVVTPSLSRVSGLQNIKYLCVKLVNTVPYMTFGFYRNEKFLDWESSDGVGKDAAAYLVTGAVTAGDSSVAKQVPYLTLHFTKTDSVSNTAPLIQNPSSCIVTSQWDWATSAISHKWSPPFQGYRYKRAYEPSSVDGILDTGFGVVTTKNKLRGRGKAFSLRMETEALKDCKILGWSLALNGNSAT